MRCRAAAREDRLPALVTPTSQIVGTQAVLNVVLGERSKIISKEVKDYCKGLYGRPPAELNPDLVKKAIGDEERITVRPADVLEPGLEQAREEIGDLAENDEDVVSYAMFPAQAREFFELRLAGMAKPIEEPRIFAAKPAANAVSGAAAPGAAATTAQAPLPPRPARVERGTSLWKISSRVAGRR